MHAYKCVYIYIFRFTPLIYEEIDIPCQLWPPYFSYIICILENKCSSLKNKQKNHQPKNWWRQHSISKHNLLHVRKLQTRCKLTGPLIWLLCAKKNTNPRACIPSDEVLS